MTPHAVTPQHSRTTEPRARTPRDTRLPGRRQVISRRGLGSGRTSTLIALPGSLNIIQALLASWRRARVPWSWSGNGIRPPAGRRIRQQGLIMKTRSTPAGTLRHLAFLTTKSAWPGIREMESLRGAGKPARVSQPRSCAGVYTCAPELR